MQARLLVAEPLSNEAKIKQKGNEDIQNVSAFADPEDREVFKVNWNKPATSGAFCLQK